MTTKYDNRTHPMFQGQSFRNTLNLGLTTHCSMRCPSCSIAVPKIKEEGRAAHAKMADVYRTAMFMKPLRRVHLTGGEPTLHPYFVSFAQCVKVWFDAEYLTLETNGLSYHKFREEINDHFDLVFITHYQKDAVYEGSPDNTAILEFAERDLGEKLIREAPVRHVPAHETIKIETQYGIKLGYRQYTAKSEVPCSKYFDPGLPAGWYDNKLYRCCVSVGIDRNLGIEVDENWKDKLVAADMGCAACCFKGT